MQKAPEHLKTHLVKPEKTKERLSTTTKHNKEAGAEVKPAAPTGQHRQALPDRGVE